MQEHVGRVKERGSRVSRESCSGCGLHCGSRLLVGRLLLSGSGGMLMCLELEDGSLVLEHFTFKALDCQFQ